MPDLRLAIPAIALWAACGVLVALPSAAGAVAAACLVGASALLAHAVLGRRSGTRAGGRRRHRLAPIAALALILSGVGAVCVAALAPGRTSEELERSAAESQTVRLELRVDNAPRAAAAGFGSEQRWSWRATTTADGGAAPGIPVSVVSPADPAELRRLAFGAVVSVEGRLRAREPGEATTFALRAAGPARTTAQPPWWLSWTAPVRSAFAEAAARTPGDGGALLPGLAIGDETAVPASLDEAMKTSSLSHLTAVSGANCALVTGLVFFLAGRAGAGRRTRIVLAATALAAFVALVGPGASVIRAAAMATVLLIALARGRPADGLPALALAVVVLLVHDPWLSRDYGFALSVLATGGLLLLAQPLMVALSRWMPRSVALVVAVPLAAQLACQPVLVLLAPTVPLLGVPANLVAEPAAPLATVLGCLACALLPVAPVLGESLVRIAWLPSAWIAQVARLCSSLPGAALPWAEGALGVLLCSAVLAVVALMAFRRAVHPWIAVTASVSLLAGGLVYAGVLAGNTIGRTFSPPPDWQIAACDVGQGDGLLVRDGGQVMMIDVGREPEPARACLDRLGVSQLEMLVLTHYDADHAGGASGVADRTRRALVGPPTRPADERTLQTLISAGVEVQRGSAGLSGRLGAVTWRLLWPVADAGGEQETGNDGSLTVETEGRGMRAIFLGDLGEDPQDALLATGAVRPVDVVKVAHHGSADQSPRLYERLRAKVGLVSVGRRNGYGHPTDRALGMLSAVGTAAVRTDEQGLLLVSPGRGAPTVWAERAADRRAGGCPYPGGGRGGTWLPEAAAEPARAEAAPAEHGRRRASSRSSPGTGSGRRPWSSSPAPRASSPTARCARSATSSKPPIPASRSATSTQATTRRASSSRSRAPPSSASRG